MVEIAEPGPLDRKMAAALASTKDAFVRDGMAVTQHGAAAISSPNWPGWPDRLDSAGPAIETFVADGIVAAMSSNEPYVSAWLPLARWIDDTVRAALSGVGISLAGRAYITASITESASLEGTAHMDDDLFDPSDDVGVVALLGQHVGPRVATTPLSPQTATPQSQITFASDILNEFEVGAIDHCQCGSDELVVFPQFAQLHAGPAAAALNGTTTRQLVVMRARVESNDR